MTPGTGKYESLLARCAALDPIPTAVVHPCEKTALAGTIEAGEKTFEISATGYLPESRTLTLSGRDARLDVQLSAGMRVSGVVTTEGGVPVPDAAVRATSAASASTQKTTRTDANGAFQLDSMAPGHYTFAGSIYPKNVN